MTDLANISNVMKNKYYDRFCKCNYGGGDGFGAFSIPTGHHLSHPMIFLSFGQTLSQFPPTFVTLWLIFGTFHLIFVKYYIWQTFSPALLAKPFPCNCPTFVQFVRFVPISGAFYPDPPSILTFHDGQLSFYSI